MNDYKFKTDPFRHQEESFYQYRDKAFHAHLWEQRCGKSKVTIDSAAWLYQQGRITGMVVIAPCGVHHNWIKNELPAHMPNYVGCNPVTWFSNPNAEQKRSLEKLLNGSGLGLRALSMNIEALRSKKALDYLKKFLNCFRCLLVIDEGSIIKNMGALQTKEVLKLKKLAPYRRVLNGTPVTNSPLDIFAQFNFLDEQILGTSHVSFRARYAIVEMQGKMKWEVKKRLEGIAASLGTYCWGEMTYAEMKGYVEAGIQPLADGWQPIDFTIKQCGLARYQMDWTVKCTSFYRGSEILRFEQGQVYPVITGYRYLEELQQRIKPYSDRVLKADCLDLPDKIYSKRYVEMSDQQEKMYKDLKKECIAQIGQHTMSASMAITKLLRLQQLLGGFFVPDISIDINPEQMTLDWDEFEERLATKISREALLVPGPNKRIEALLSDIENGLEGKGIIWARFTAEIRAIAKALREKYGCDSVAELYGEVDSSIRQRQIDIFQQAGSTLRFLVANPQCKGVSRGQNMCAASWEWYYSNSFSLEDRLQSEDRPHSPGQNNNLAVIDAICPDTVDEKIVEALRNKVDLARQVTGDVLREWI